MSGALALCTMCGGLPCAIAFGGGGKADADGVCASLAVCTSGGRGIALPSIPGMGNCAGLN